MSINEIMKIGTKGMSKAQKAAEQERRVKVVERINQIGEKIARIDVQLRLLPDDYKCCKVWRQRKNGYIRQINRIKGEESLWLKDAAWFMY